MTTTLPLRYHLVVILIDGTALWLPSIHKRHLLHHRPRCDCCNTIWGEHCPEEQYSEYPYLIMPCMHIVGSLCLGQNVDSDDPRCPVCDGKIQLATEEDRRVAKERWVLDDDAPDQEQSLRGDSPDAVADGGEGGNEEDEQKEEGGGKGGSELSRDGNEGVDTEMGGAEICGDEASNSDDPEDDTPKPGSSANAPISIASDDSNSESDSDTSSKDTPMANQVSQTTVPAQSNANNAANTALTTPATAPTDDEYPSRVYFDIRIHYPKRPGAAHTSTNKTSEPSTSPAVTNNTSTPALTSSSTTTDPQRPFNPFHNTFPRAHSQATSDVRSEPLSTPNPPHAPHTVRTRPPHTPRIHPYHRPSLNTTTNPPPSLPSQSTRWTIPLVQSAIATLNQERGLDIEMDHLVLMIGLRNQFEGRGWTVSARELGSVLGEIWGVRL